MSDHLRIATALGASGWHPGAAGLDRAFALATWRELIGTAEGAGIDFVTIEDSFVRRDAGHLDALLIASAVAPSTSRIGLVPTVTTAHTEPFHVATGLQTLDHASRGRGGWRVQIGDARAEAPLFGRRDPDALPLGDLLDEAGDVIEVARLLWDSWQDDAVIRDVETGRYFDRDRIHGAHFNGRFFGVEGASIVPRPPQGQLPVTVLAHAAPVYELAARHADVVYVTPSDDGSAAALLGEVRDAEHRVRRTGESLRVYADLLVLLGDSAASARDELARLDEAAGAPLASDALVVATTADDLVNRIAAWHALGYAGFRLRPARLPEDLVRIGRDVLPLLDAAGLHGAGDETGTLRTRLGLPEAPNRYTDSQKKEAVA
ncbi:FMNH2-utilizing oxygenase [Frondihabitans sucicola]|uniref:FMNH2-utilizing oxygenase n=1 Tax=Frondihabitans sucicola TaxID=1268041 RepID=A0ABN6XX01_9MICO|nr:LLM class flavin-dependent oxidoreductase [Frondihabitans sucicola]BDZ49436.1 FMNH2-utilizing oxygenase [Frondihabitans sucicola]